MLLVLPGDPLRCLGLVRAFAGAITASFFSVFTAALCVLAPRFSVAYDALDDVPDCLEVIIPLVFASEE